MSEHAPTAHENNLYQNRQYNEVNFSYNPVDNNTHAFQVVITGTSIILDLYGYTQFEISSNSLIPYTVLPPIPAGVLSYEVLPVSTTGSQSVAAGTLNFGNQTIATEIGKTYVFTVVFRSAVVTGAVTARFNFTDITQNTVINQLEFS